MDSGLYLQGIDLFNQAAFFECHEMLEDAWRVAPEPERKFLQGLIQTAVAFHHYSKGNPAGTRSLLKRALRNLAGYPVVFGGLDLAPLRQSIADWQAALENGVIMPPLPTLKSCNHRK